jgi:thiamine-monophosphate kinase
VRNGERRCVKLDERALLLTVGRIIGEDRIRDDCAVIPWKGEYLVATTDMLHRTTDFPVQMTSWQMGWHSAAVSLSDIAAMAAEPLFLLLSVGLDDPDLLGGIITGASCCCRENGCELVGGDLDAHNECTVVSSAVGTVPPERLVRRRGANPGDLVVVTGVPGRAAAGLAGYRGYERYLLEPSPRIREGVYLGTIGATSMMDMSDGLALSLYDLLAAGGHGFKIVSSAIPGPEGVSGEERLLFSLHGGGDYELVATLPPDRQKDLLAGMTVIGTVIDEEVVLADGKELEKKGYEHHWTG